jgi:hypothetical protein
MTNADAFNRRLTAVAGISLAVFLIVGLLLPGTPPKADDSIREITNFFVDKRGSILASDFFVGLGGFAFFVFVGGLARYLRSRGDDTDGLVGIAFGGGVAALVLLLAGVAVTNGIAFKAAGSGDQVRLAFDTLNDLFFMASFPFAVFFGAASWAAARRGALPGWTVWLGVLAGLLMLLGAIGLFAKSGFFATGGALGFIGPTVATLWVIAVSVFLFRGAPAAATASGRA